MAPVETVSPPTPPAAQTTVRVIVLRSIQEDGRKYTQDEQFGTSPERAQVLQDLGLVRVLDPQAPPPGPKLQAERDRLRDIGLELSARRKELVEIEGDVHRAEDKVVTLRAGLNATDGLEAARDAQNALAEAERDLGAARQLQANQQRRVRELVSREQDALKLVRGIERQIEEMVAATPGLEQNVAGQQRSYEAKLREAEMILQHGVRSTKEALSKHLAELKALKG